MASAPHDNFPVLVERAVASGAEMDPAAYQVFLSGHAKPPVPGGERQQDCCGTVLIARLGGNRFVIAIDLDLSHGLGR